MTGQERDYDEVLSRVLHSTTDHIEPVGDGLTKIQARLAEPWLKRQWWLLRSETATIGWVLAVRCQSWFNAMRSGSAARAGIDAVTAGHASASAARDGGRLRPLPVIGGIAARASAKRPRHASSPLRNSVGPAMAWLRPALAVAGAVVLVVAGGFALTQLQGTLFGSLTGSNTPGPVSTSNPGGGGNANGSGSPASSGTGASSSTQASAAPTKPSTMPSSKASPAQVFLSPPLSPAPSPPTSPPPTSPPPTSSPGSIPGNSPVASATP